MLAATAKDPPPVACIIAEPGDPACFGSAKALATYVRVVPRLRQSVSGRRMLPLGNARIRCPLWMPTLSAICVNLWLPDHYLLLRLEESGSRLLLLLRCCWSRSLAPHGADSHSLHHVFFRQPLPGTRGRRGSS